ncbi:class I SAM-dependent methyltransferase [Marinicella sp. S1101]|uniref:class I SAM-dependent methyltransferase n=1 Tax=Marinicella marina TaxID=2996016 RepID=UPI002260A3A6|nr:class I SAM-dependent methyltransferase [Marinicella marina]MCX7552648.1 class I SAM-dependent methyltransferase [Marinicella marina]MDJ1139524.1 class I SAM-dependent methyltransferase [Marinicella marina]
MTESGLTFTGERFLPDCEREIWYEHYHRYTMALDWVADKKVLDAACGEGYGSHLMAQTASSVDGVDIDPTAVEHATSRYQRSNLKFHQSDVLNLAFEDDSFDVVVSFETLEHLAEHEALLAEFKRVLKPDGVLLISTPDKKEYSDKTGFNNEYHVRELYQDEFKQMIDEVFTQQHWFGQKLLFSSAIWRLDTTPKTVQFDCLDSKNNVSNQPLFEPVYLIVAASNGDLSNSKGQDLYNFTEQSEQIYGHYNAVIRAHIKAENDYKALAEKQQSWLNHPIIGRCIRWFERK